MAGGRGCGDDHCHRERAGARRARAEFDRPFAELDRSEQCFVLTLHTEWAGTAWTSQGAQTLEDGLQVLRRDGLTVTHPGDHAAHL